MNLLRSFCVLVLAATGATAEILRVPEDHPDLDAAVAAAAPNDTIRLGPGTWGPVTVDRPLRIVGVGNPTITSSANATDFRSPVTLAGYGAGRVRVAGVRVSGSIDGIYHKGGGAAFAGGGFESLELYDCVVDGPSWSFVTDRGAGQCAVDVRVPYVVLERTIARASGAIANGPVTTGLAGAPGVRADGTVLLVDSIVRGGSTGPFTHASLGCAGACPEARGGNGVECYALFRAASSVSPGFGAPWVDLLGQVCCVEPDGVPVRAGTITELGGQLNGTGVATVGGAFSLSWSFSEPFAGLYFSPNLVPAVQVAGSTSFLDPSNVVPLGMVFTGGNLGFLIPPTASGVVGLPFAFQLLFPSGAVSRPVAGVVFD